MNEFLSTKHVNIVNISNVFYQVSFSVAFANWFAAIRVSKGSGVLIQAGFIIKSIKLIVSWMSSLLEKLSVDI